MQKQGHHITHHPFVPKNFVEKSTEWSLDGAGKLRLIADRIRIKPDPEFSGLPPDIVASRISHAQMLDNSQYLISYPSPGGQNIRSETSQTRKIAEVSSKSRNN
ncbi:hypothetical protein ACFE04_007459 [Oxalis oulophora]